MRARLPGAAFGIEQDVVAAGDVEEVHALVTGEPAVGDGLAPHAHVHLLRRAVGGEEAGARGIGHRELAARAQRDGFRAPEAIGLHFAVPVVAGADGEKRLQRGGVIAVVDMDFTCFRRIDGQPAIVGGEQGGGLHDLGALLHRAGAVQRHQLRAADGPEQAGFAIQGGLAHAGQIHAAGDVQVRAGEE